MYPAPRAIRTPTSGGHDPNGGFPSARDVAIDVGIMSANFDRSSASSMNPYLGLLLLFGICLLQITVMPQA